MNRHHLESVLSRGNRTEVSSLRDPSTGDVVVKKRLLPFADVSEQRRALHLEAVLQNAVGAPGVVPVRGVNDKGALPVIGNQPPPGEAHVITRSFVDGRTLRELLHEDARAMSRELCHFWMAELCETLEFIHHAKTKSGQTLGIVHRDVTPGNVFVERQGLNSPVVGTVYLNDFGLCHVKAWGPLADDETLQGTRSFIAPELVRGEQPEARSDVFQAGMLLSAMLVRASGRKLAGSTGDARAGLIRSILQTHPVMHALDPKPQNRPTAREFGAALRRL